jgi:hypothetical protein
MPQSIARTACIPTQSGLNRQGNQPHYRAEFNPLSSRWMVLSDKDECFAAGLSHDKAETIARDLMN